MTFRNTCACVCNNENVYSNTKFFAESNIGYQHDYNLIMEKLYSYHQPLYRIECLKASIELCSMKICAPINTEMQLVSFPYHDIVYCANVGIKPRNLTDKIYIYDTIIQQLKELIRWHFVICKKIPHWNAQIVLWPYISTGIGLTCPQINPNNIKSVD